jgi:hypothetical protein
MLSKLFGQRLKLQSQIDNDNGDASDVIQRIGTAAIAAAHDSNGKILLYAEVEDDAISADLFSQSSEGPVRFRHAPPDLKALVYQFWETFPVNERWATMTYSIDGGRFDCSFRYPDALSPDEDLAERRPRVVDDYFGKTAVDYSSPR